MQYRANRKSGIISLGLIKDMTPWASGKYRKSSQLHLEVSCKWDVVVMKLQTKLIPGTTSMARKHAHTQSIGRSTHLKLNVKEIDKGPAWQMVNNELQYVGRTTKKPKQTKR